ncbi:MAG: hypothetical protein ACOYXR_09310 [Nitrospirota bacterium]
MTAPVVKVELGLGSTWQTEPASITWADVTQFVLQPDRIVTQRGASSARGQIDVGTMGLAFTNAASVLDLPGAGTDYASTPDTAALDITGDLDVRARVVMDDWTPGAVSALVSKINAAAFTGYELRVNTSGNVILAWGDGAAVQSNTSSAVTGVANGGVKWVRATLDVDNGAAGRDVKFYLSDDAVTWTQLGSTQTTAGVTSIAAGTTDLWVGARPGGTFPLAGSVWFAQVLNGIGGTVVADPDFSVQQAGVSSFTDSTGLVWTVNGSAKILRDGRRFDPTYTLGPFYVNLKPGVPVRVTGTPAGQSSKSVWYGSVASYPQRYDLGNKFAWVPVQAYDGFDKLARAKMPRSPLEALISASSPIVFFPLDETSGTEMTDRSGNDFHGTYVGGTTDLTTQVGTFKGIAFDGSHSGATTNASAAYTVEQIEAVIDLDDAALTDGSKYTIAEFASGNSVVFGNLALVWFGFEVVSASAKTIKLRTEQRESETITASGLMHVAIDDASGTFYLDGVALTVSPVTTDRHGAAKPGASVGISYLYGTTRRMVGKVSHVVAFNTPISGSTLAERSSAALTPLDNQTTDTRIGFVLDEIDWPTNLRNLESGDTTLGPATFKPGDSALEYLRLIEATEDGRLFTQPDGKLRFHNRYWRYLNTLAVNSQFTFTDADTTKGYAEFQLDLDDELLVNVARFTRRDGTEQVATNTTSKNTYGEAEKQQGDLLLRTDNEVRSLAQWTVATQGTPLPRVPKIRVPLHAYSAADQATVLGLDIGHRVTCVRTPQGVGSAVSTAFLIDGVRNEIGEGEWWWEAYVQPVPADTAQVFVLGTSELSGTHILGF